MPDLRDFHEMGWIMVSMLWVSAEDKATQSKVQSKIADQKEASCGGYSRYADLAVAL